MLKYSTNIKQTRPASSASLLRPPTDALSATRIWCRQARQAGANTYLRRGALRTPEEREKIENVVKYIRILLYYNFIKAQAERRVAYSSISP